MKTYQFTTILSAKGDFKVPKRILRHLNKHKVRVILFADESEQEKQDWNRFAMEQFLQGYDVKDSVYDRF